MTLSIQSIVNLTNQFNNQIANPEKSFRQELKECNVETKVHTYTYSRYLETYVNGVLVSEDRFNDIYDNFVSLTIEDIELFLNNKLSRTKYQMQTR
jgi:ribonucleotide reductase beta subunit family protein with ferritin-like domain